MNKKLFLSMFAAAGMLLATSCSNDELEAVQSGNEAQVTFSLGLEGGIATRAISDGTGAKKLVCAVYDADNEVIKTISINNQAVDATTGQFVNDNAFQGGLTDQINVTLAKGQTYTMVFWAQNGACDAYDTDDLKAVEIDYTNGAEGTAATGDFNNDETRDAFYAAETFKVEGNKEINVTLKRPFAQINVGVYKSDWEAAVASGIEIEKSSVVIKNAATSINLLTGEVGEEEADVTVSYTANTIPQGEMLKVDTDGDGEKEEYHWLSMSYILVADHDETEDANGLLGTDKATLQGLQYTFIPENGEPIAFAEGLAGAPVQRNWRTNIIGKILTGDVTFNITIDPAYDDDYIYPNGQEQELAYAAAFGGTVTLTENLTLTKTLNVTADMILDLNGKTILGNWNKSEGAVIKNSANLKIVNGTVNSTGENGGSAVQNNGTMTLDNVTLNGASNSGESWPAYTVNNTGELTINNSSITSVHGAVASYGDNAIVTLNNTNIEMGGIAGFTSHGIYTYSNGQVIVNGGNIANNATDQNSTGGSVINGAVTVNAGTFTGRIEGDYDTPVLKGGTYTVNPSAKFVAEGYTAVGNGDGTWTVAQTITSENIVEVLNSLSTTEPTTLVLSGNITSDEDVTIPEGAEVTINLNNQTITTSASDAFVVNKDATLTISGNGKVESNGAPIRAIGGKVIVEDGEFTQTGAWNTTVSTYRYSVDSREGGEIIIKGGTFKTSNGMINVNENSSVVIEGGNFEYDNNNGGTRHFANVSGKLTINNGEFKGVADSSAGGSFFRGAAAGCEIQINGGKFTSLWTSGSVNKIFEADAKANGATIDVTGGLFNANGGIESFVEANTDGTTKDAYPYKAK